MSPNKPDDILRGEGFRAFSHWSLRFNQKSRGGSESTNSLGGLVCSWGAIARTFVGPTLYA